MQTINGKLITQEQNQLDILKQQNDNMIRRCQHLESQITTTSQQQSIRYIQEINTVKTHLQKLDKKIILLEQTVSKKFIQFVIMNICSAIGLVGFWFCFEMNNQSTYRDTKLQKHPVSVELYRHKTY